jgi:hypothetical protein
MDIPITFQFRGKTFSGHLLPVMGAGASSVWHLVINKFFYGRLRLTDGKWFFDTNKRSEGMEELADEFGNYVILWHQ